MTFRTIAKADRKRSNRAFLPFRRIGLPRHKMCAVDAGATHDLGTRVDSPLASASTCAGIAISVVSRNFEASASIAAHCDGTRRHAYSPPARRAHAPRAETDSGVPSRPSCP